MDDMTLFDEHCKKCDISVSDLSYKTGYSTSQIWDLIDYEDELVTVYSVNEVYIFAREFKCRPIDLIVRDFDLSHEGMSLTEFHDYIGELVDKGDLNVEEVFSRTGWDPSRFLRDKWYPLDNWTVEDFQEVCDEVEVDWRKLFVKFHLREESKKMSWVESLWGKFFKSH